MKQVLRRLADLVPLMLFVTFVCFLLLQSLPGDPSYALLGEEGFLDPELRAQTQRELGLDRPFFVQYASWVGGVFQGDLGDLYISGANQSVLDVIKARLPTTVEVGIVSMGLALLISIPLAVLSGYRAGSTLDRSIGMSNYALIAAPAFILGPLFIYFFGLKLRWLPVGNLPDWGDGPVEHIRSLVMPATVLALSQVPTLTRVLRSDVISTLSEDYITLARAMGYSDKRILFRHAFRPSSLALLTVVGVNIGNLVGGTVIVETLFNINGLGSELVEGVASREYALVLGIVTVVSMIVLVVNATVDALYPLIDPRIRRAR